MSAHSEFSERRGSRFRGLWLGLVLGALVICLLAAAFGGGFVVGTRSVESQTVAAIEAERVMEAERDALRTELANLKQQGIACERFQQIEQEKDRSAVDTLKEAQDERLAMAKEIATLKRLIKTGGSGAVGVQGLRLSAGDGPRAFTYSFTVSQLIDDVGETSGEIAIKVSGKQGEKDKSLTLKEMEGSEPTTLAMRFEHFQNFEGRLVLPEGFEPLSLSVDVEPKGDKLIASGQTFPWALSE